MRIIQPTKECSACGACVDACPKGAISIKEDKKGYLYPIINQPKCISCGMCSKVCANEKKDDKKDFVPTAYIARTYDKERYDISASGGIFGTLASEFIKSNGIVYGAAIINEGNTLNCKHIRVEALDKLHTIQGSKYVHSETQGIYACVLKDLTDGKKVLFSGTSCQVAALNCFLGKHYDNLFTVDLVCHGVPPISMFHKYIHYLEKKNKYQINNISFRKKGKPGFDLDKDSYVITLFLNKDNEPFEKYISSRYSGYYSLFRARAGYRPNCYICRYASIKKQGDITLGDFVPRGNEFDKYKLSDKNMYSTILVNNDHGKNLFNTISNHCFYSEIDIETVMRHHANLSNPSKCGRKGKIMMHIYRGFSFAGLEIYLGILTKVRRIYHLIQRKGI